MSENHKHSYVCENCGNESNMTIKEEEVSAAEHDKPKKKIVVCKECGNEANMTLEEIEI